MGVSVAVPRVGMHGPCGGDGARLGRRALISGILPTVLLCTGATSPHLASSQLTCSGCSHSGGESTPRWELVWGEGGGPLLSGHLFICITWVAVP